VIRCADIYWQYGIVPEILPAFWGAIMRGVAVALGALLLIGGAVVVVVADQERVASLNQVRAAVEQVEGRLNAAKEVNYGLAEQLTMLRSRIAEQDQQLTDTTGFLQ
jgi:septal ring factor EnvC (AmiA/AmiB activator)